MHRLILLVILIYVAPAIADITLVCDQSSKVVIVIPSTPTDYEQFAAEELQDAIRKISSVTVPIQSSDQSIAYAIHIGKTIFNHSKLDLSNLPAESFIIKTLDNKLCLAGNDDRGALFAVYTFLESYLGVRWFWPGELGEVIPHQKTISIPDIDDQQQPDFILRRIEVTLHRPEHCPKTNKTIGGHKLNENELWCLRNKLGGSTNYGGNTHDFHFIAPPDKYGATHPEYFALVDGKRDCDPATFDGKHGCQLCTTNPDVIRLSIEYARNVLDQHKDVDAVSISPNDGGGFCECDHCKALDASAQNIELGAEVMEQTEKHVDEKGKPIISDRIFTYANEVARGVRQTHPDKSILILAYAQYVEPPLKVKLEKNIWVQLCLNSDFLCNDEFYKKRMGQFDRWLTATNNLLIYDYLAWRGGPDLPRNIAPWIQHFLRKCKTAGVNKYFTQSRDNFGSEGLDYFIAAKLLWNADLEANAVLDDYADKCFGPAAKPMRTWFALQADRWQEAVKTIGSKNYAGSAEYYLNMFTPEIRSLSHRLFDQAKTLADPGVLKRIEFFEKEFHYTELTLDYINTLLALDKAGLLQIKTTYLRPHRVRGQDIANVTPDHAKILIQNVQNAWQQRQAYVEQIKDQHILDYRHIRNNVDKDYKFSPEIILQTLQQRYPAP